MSDLVKRLSFNSHASPDGSPPGLPEAVERDAASCKTPGCVYHITTSGKTLNIKVDLPISFDGVDDDALHEHLHISAEHLVWTLFTMLPHLVWNVHPSELAAIPAHDRVMKRRAS